MALVLKISFLHANYMKLTTNALIVSQPISLKIKNASKIIRDVLDLTPPTHKTASSVDLVKDSKMANAKVSLTVKYFQGFVQAAQIIIS